MIYIFCIEGCILCVCVCCACVCMRLCAVVTMVLGMTVIVYFNLQKK